jgi:hypothetical protein
VRQEGACHPSSLAVEAAAAVAEVAVVVEACQEVSFQTGVAEVA